MYGGSGLRIEYDRAIDRNLLSIFAKLFLSASADILKYCEGCRANPDNGSRATPRRLTHHLQNVGKHLKGTIWLASISR